ncbi:MAG: CDP-diacylglycerol--serine O-phosphatidyltransferase [candidate division Zixibacteria bacterium]|nr:CDP-diacylglycerol--serine O-phosphatidyltransferase [candidate division Zixibacteria bacterium]
MRSYRALVPNSFTMGNMLCGFLSILSCLEGNAITAAWLIVLGAFLDSLDGRIARISKVSSSFGVELDSFSDFCTFGVATAVLIHAFGLSTLGRWGWIVSGVYVMCSGYRLARFNMQATLEEKKKFLGLPVPIASLLLVSYVIFSYELWGEIKYIELLISMIGAVSVLMVSSITYETFPENLSTVENKLKFLLLFAFIIGVIIKPRLVMFPAVLAYMLTCLVRELVTMLRGEQGATPLNRNSKKRSGKDGQSQN